MNPWLIAAIALLPGLAAPLWIAFRGSLADRLAALQLASGLTSVMLVLMSFAFDQSSLIDLPLTLSFLALPGSLLFAIFVERWM